MTQNEFKSLYASALAESGLSQKELAELNGMSANALQLKINRGTIKFIEFATIMESIGYKITLKKVEKQ